MVLNMNNALFKQSNFDKVLPTERPSQSKLIVRNGLSLSNSSSFQLNIRPKFHVDATGYRISVNINNNSGTDDNYGFDLLLVEGSPTLTLVEVRNHEIRDEESDSWTWTFDTKQITLQDSSTVYPVKLNFFDGFAGGVTIIECETLFDEILFIE